jgi:hypothetical protein
MAEVIEKGTIAPENQQRASQAQATIMRLYEVI